MLDINKIYNLDCLAGMQQLEAGSVDMILTDLPYGMTSCRWDAVIPLGPLWEQFKRVAKPNAAIVLTAQQPFTTQLIASNPKMFKYCWYWHKNQVTGFPNAKKQPLRCVEDVVIFYRRQPTYNPQGIIKLSTPKKCKAKQCRVYDSSLAQPYTTMYTNYPRQILNIPVQRDGLHPTQKPVALMEYLIKTYTDPGQLVLDACMGSGTTAVAAINTGRQYIGFELDQEYYEISQRRIQDLQ